MLPVVKYFLARLVLFLACTAVLGLLGAGRFAALVGGLFVSLMLSYVLLRRLRDPATAAIAERVQARIERRAPHPDEDALVEDAQVDEALREAGSRDEALREARSRDEALPEGDRRV